MPEGHLTIGICNCSYTCLIWTREGTLLPTPEAVVTAAAPVLPYSTSLHCVATTVPVYDALIHMSKASPCLLKVRHQLFMQSGQWVDIIDHWSIFLNLWSI